MTFFQKAGKLSYRKQSIGKFIAKLKNAHFPHFQLAGQGVNTIKKQKFYIEQFINKVLFISRHIQAHTDTKIKPENSEVLDLPYKQAHTGTYRQQFGIATDQKAGGSNPSRRTKSPRNRLISRTFAFHKFRF